MEKVPKRRTKYTRTGYQSPIEVALEVIGGKYKPVILYELRRGPQRYSDLRRAVKSATQKMLTQHLRERRAFQSGVWPMKSTAYRFSVRGGNH